MPSTKPVDAISSLRKPSTRPRVRFPCATVVPNGLSVLARSTSTWIHWSSPESSAKVLIISCVTSRHSLGPTFSPRSSRSPSIPLTVAIAMTGQAIRLRDQPDAEEVPGDRAGAVHQAEDPSDVPLGFGKRRDAVVAIDGAGARVVGGERESGGLVFRQEVMHEVCLSVDRRLPVERVAEPIGIRGPGRELSEAASARGTHSEWIEVRFGV